MRKQKSGPKRWKRMGWIGLFILVIWLAYFCSKNVCQLMLIQGDSMAPTYRSFQLVLLDKRNRDFSRGDVIAFHCEGLSAVLVKRVAASPGDTVVIQTGTLFVNGKISEVYGEEGIFEDSGLLTDLHTLNDKEYIVIGDNISQSKDSRFPEVGIVEKDTIIGKVVNAKSPK